MNEWMKGWFASESTEHDKIEVKRIYIDLNEGNLYDGVIFSQIMYWHGSSRENGKPRMTIEREGNLWLAKGYGDWFVECRIGEATARQCISRIEKRGLIIKKLWKFNNTPTIHIRIDWDSLEEQLKWICGDISNGFDTTYQIGFDTTRQMNSLSDSKSLTETTSNTTTKTTANKTAPKGATSQKPPKKLSYPSNAKSWEWKHLEQYACENPTIELLAAFNGMGSQLKNLPTAGVARDAVELFHELNRSKVAPERWEKLHTAGLRIKNPASIFKRMMWALPDFLRTEPPITIVQADDDMPKPTRPVIVGSEKTA